MNDASRRVLDALTTLSTEGTRILGIDRINWIVSPETPISLAKESVLVELTVKLADYHRRDIRVHGPISTVEAIRGFYEFCIQNGLNHNLDNHLLAGPLPVDLVALMVEMTD